MAKKASPPKQAPDGSKQLKQAIITVKQLQTFLCEHGGVEKAVAAVVKVQDLVKLTGGFPELKQALEIVGQDSAPADECAAATPSM
jgi:hypothetical protein